MHFVTASRILGHVNVIDAAPGPGPASIPRLPAGERNINETLRYLASPASAASQQEETEHQRTVRVLTAAGIKPYTGGQQDEPGDEDGDDYLQDEEEGE